MLYSTLRAVARVGLHWYYSEVIVQGGDRIPVRGPMLVVANHPNALVDALLVGTSIPRRVLITAKATLFEHSLLAPLFAAVGVVPLRRAKDERAVSGRDPLAARNDDTFQLVTEALGRGGAVLIFPEGISHDQPALAPVKSGAARMALRAREVGTRGVKVLPVGLVFEEKERPRSRALVRIGEPIDLDALHVDGDVTTAGSLTARIERALRNVTLNFATDDDAARAIHVARALTALSETPRRVGSPSAFGSEVEMASRVERATQALETAPSGVIERVDRFINRLTALEQRCKSLGVELADSRISVRAHRGVWFVLRELLVLGAVGPLALLGWLTHWLPVRLARTLALRSLANDPSRDQPAMRTIVLGAGLIVVWYALQAFVVGRWFGAVAALLWLVLIFAAGQLALVLEDRLSRARARARTYLALRRHPELREDIIAEREVVLAEAIAIEKELIATSPPGSLLTGEA
jgi:glycerol-3-phosphate O-acyltransferase / dihydroxyacetone phosphate acyltransferase